MSVILAIESAVAGGSVCLLRNGVELAGWVGADDSRPRAELLVSEIDRVIAKARVMKYDIDALAVSAGPGSFTGIRVGLATAYGLKAALGTPLSTISALAAVSAGVRGEVIVCLPMGRASACIQSFRDGQEQTPPMTVPEAEVTKAIGSSKVTVIVHPGLAELLSGRDHVQIDPNVARLIGNFAYAHGSLDTAPIFLSKR